MDASGARRQARRIAIGVLLLAIEPGRAGSGRAQGFSFLASGF
jgi:hypothetical protein